MSNHQSNQQHPNLAEFVLSTEKIDERKTLAVFGVLTTCPSIQKIKLLHDFNGEGSVLNSEALRTFVPPTCSSSSSDDGRSSPAPPPKTLDLRHQAFDEGSISFLCSLGPNRRHLILDLCEGCMPSPLKTLGGLSSAQNSSVLDDITVQEMMMFEIPDVLISFILVIPSQQPATILGNSVIGAASKILINKLELHLSRVANIECVTALLHHIVSQDVLASPTILFDDRDGDWNEAGPNNAGESIGNHDQFLSSFSSL